LHTIPSLVSGSAIPVNKHGIMGMSPVAGAIPVELCQEDGADTYAFNPDSPTPVGNKYGYKMNTGFDAIDKTISKIVYYFANTTSATGSIDAYVGTSSSATKIGTVDVSTIGGSTAGGNPVTFDSDSHEVSVNDIFWVENNEDRNDKNLAIYWTGGTPTTSPLSNTTVMWGASAVGKPPPVDTGDLVPSKVCITYS